MKTVNLRISDLRKNKKATQQEVADAVGVSYQTVSKWETQNSMPDITLLPALAEFFGVTTDQLLRLVPLAGEVYVPEKSGSREFWADRADYLLRTRNSFWNVDYLEFLIRKVWKIDRPVKMLDCGCGFGSLGLLMLPLLPEGSTYTGIDFSENLIELGKQLFEERKLNAVFHCTDVFDYPAQNSYDLVICQAVMRHLDSPAAFLRKMIGFGKPGSLIVSIDVNREFEHDGLCIHGMDYEELCRHEALSKKWRTELNMQGRDYAFCMRTGCVMEQLGLEQIDVRVQDKAEFVSPRLPDYEQRKADFLSANGWDSLPSEKEREEIIKSLISRGASRKEAEAYCERNVKITEFFAQHPDASYTFTRALLITFGRKAQLCSSGRHEKCVIEKS